MFSFKKFTIEQDRTAMKVGTDGVLLGAWVSMEGARSILDIGTGTGLIALMMAQRNAAARVDAVEIDRASAEQAAENVSRSDWADRVSIHHSDIQSFAPAAKYDLIVTNPPYFVNSLHSPSSSRTAARHTCDLSFRDLALSAVRLLSGGGRFALILPLEESRLFDCEALGRLTLARRCEVRSREATPVKRVMSEYTLLREGVATTREELTIERGTPPQFSEEYRALTADFYLKF